MVRWSSCQTCLRCIGEKGGDWMSRQALLRDLSELYWRVRETSVAGPGSSATVKLRSRGPMFRQTLSASWLLVSLVVSTSPFPALSLSVGLAGPSDQSWYTQVYNRTQDQQTSKVVQVQTVWYVGWHVRLHLHTCIHTHACALVHTHTCAHPRGGTLARSVETPTPP